VTFVHFTQPAGSLAQPPFNYRPASLLLDICIQNPLLLLLLLLLQASLV
jgi:hypothetical protein